MALLGWGEIPWGDLAFPTVHWILSQAQALRGRPGPLVTVGNPGQTPAGSDSRRGRSRELTGRAHLICA